MTTPVPHKPRIGSLARDVFGGSKSVTGYVQPAHHVLLKEWSALRALSNSTSILKRLVLPLLELMGKLALAPLHHIPRRPFSLQYDRSPMVLLQLAGRLLLYLEVLVGNADTK